MKKSLKNLSQKVQNFPALPGVYLMKKQGDQIIYVGKAKSLKSRVLSYFKNPLSGLKTEFLVRQLESIDYIVTANEVEAFLLEASLIKKHNPRYNIRLKDDKSYPYIRIGLKEDFPRFYFERRVKNSKDLYFGPYTESLSVRILLDFLNQNFHLRDCSLSDFKSRTRACLNFDMGICPAPCVQKISKKDYYENCKKAIRFLKGQSKALVKQLQIELKQSVKNLQFERSAQIRDRLRAIEQMEIRQVVVQKSDKDKDVIVLQSFKGQSLIEILHFRKGRLIGNRYQFLSLVNEEVLLSFLTQYYSENLIPDEIIVQLPIKKAQLKLLEKVLIRHKKSPCQLIQQLNRMNSLLIKRAEINGLNHLKNEIQKQDSIEKALKEIQQKFHLSSLPVRIECYDISHWQGQQSVGSGVVFKKGQPLKSAYRLYNLKKVCDGDDYLALQEVLSRRLQHTEYKTPDLILIDGGKGQLKACTEVLKSLGKENWPVASLAKDRLKKQGLGFDKDSSSGERFYLPNRKNPVLFAGHSKALKILLYLRDEAHRFAISSHRKKRDKMFLKGDLDSIRGLSPAIKQKLLKHYGSLEKLKTVSLADLSRLNFISKSLAQKIKSTIK